MLVVTRESGTAQERGIEKRNATFSTEECGKSSTHCAITICVILSANTIQTRKQYYSEFVRARCCRLPTVFESRLLTDACCVPQVLLRGVSSTTGGRDHLWLAIYAKSQDKLDGQAGCRHRVVRSAFYPCSRAHGCGDRHAGSQSL